MKWFKEMEFACKCCGELPPEALENVRALVDNVLDPVRNLYGGAIRVNSGYRCAKHNKEVGGVGGSQHLLGQAADIAPVKNGITESRNNGITESRNNGITDGRELERLKEIVIANGRFDQLIVYPTFLHVSWKRQGVNRKQVLRRGGAV